jgi:hypothetical protein
MLKIEVIERSDIDCVEVWRGTRSREGMNATDFAEVMLGHHGSKLVNAKRGVV